MNDKVKTAFLSLPSIAGQFEMFTAGYEASLGASSIEPSKHTTKAIKKVQKKRPYVVVNNRLSMPFKFLKATNTILTHYGLASLVSNYLASTDKDRSKLYTLSALPARSELLKFCENSYLHDTFIRNKQSAIKELYSNHSL